MKKYRCIRDCWIQVGNRRHWTEGMEVELEDDVEVPSHFKLVGVEKYQEPPKDEGVALSTLQKQQRDAVSPKAGFASSLNAIEPEQEYTKKKRGK